METAASFSERAPLIRVSAFAFSSGAHGRRNFGSGHRENIVHSKYLHRLGYTL